MGTSKPVCAQESGAAFGRTCPKTMNVNVKILSLTNPSCLRAGFLQVAIATTVMRHTKSSFESHQQAFKGGGTTELDFNDNHLLLRTASFPETSGMKQEFGHVKVI